MATRTAIVGAVACERRLSSKKTRHHLRAVDRVNFTGRAAKPQWKRSVVLLKNVPSHLLVANKSSPDMYRAFNCSNGDSLQLNNHLPS